VYVYWRGDSYSRFNDDTFIVMIDILASIDGVTPSVSGGRMANSNILHKWELNTMTFY